MAAKFSTGSLLLLRLEFPLRVLSKKKKKRKRFRTESIPAEFLSFCLSVGLWSQEIFSKSVNHRDITHDSCTTLCVRCKARRYENTCSVSSLVFYQIPFNLSIYAHKIRFVVSWKNYALDQNLENLILRCTLKYKFIWFLCKFIFE